MTSDSLPDKGFEEWLDEMSLQERGAFIVRAANMKSLQLARRPGDLLNFLDDFRKYVRCPDPNAVEEWKGQLITNPRALDEFIALAKKIATAIADEKEVSFEHKGGVCLLQFGPNGWPRAAYGMKTILDGFLFAALHDVEQTQLIRRIRHCTRQGCEELFYAKRNKQRYCTPHCANLVASQKYRQKNAAERAGQARQVRTKNKSRRRAKRKSLEGNPR